MKKKLCFTCALVLTLCLGAKEFYCKKAGVSIWFPNNWTVLLSPTGALIAAPAGQDIFCKLDLIDGLQAGSSAVAAEFKNFRPVQKAPVNLPGGRNGMEARYIQGPAHRGGQLWDLDVSFYKAPRGTVMFLYGMMRSSEQKYKRIDAQLLRMCKSITPSSGTGW